MGRGMRGVVLTVLAMAVLAPAALGDFVAGDNPPVAGNPAERLKGRPLEHLRGYFTEVPKGCRTATPRGVSQFASWLRQNARRGSIGNRYRCENLGAGNGFSFHSEGRALDFTLNAGNPEDAAEAARLIRLLLARDSAGRGAALARRMGVMEIIWDCAYWAQSQVDEKTGVAATKPYFLCPSDNPATAHRNHVHFSFTRQGAAGASTFWWSLKRWAPAGAPVRSCPRIREPHAGFYSGYRRITVSPKSTKCSTASAVVQAMVRAEERLGNQNKFLPPEGITVKGYRCWDLDPDVEVLDADGTGHRMRICGTATRTIGIRH